MEFLVQFNSIITLTRCSGIYLPTMISPGPFILVYSCCANVILFVIFAEEMYCVLFGNMPQMMQIFVGFCAFCYFWAWVKNTFMLMNAKNTGKLFTFWSTSMNNCPLWPQLRQKELTVASGTVMRGTRFVICFLVAPMMLGCLVKLFWTQSLFLPTAFQADLFDMNASFILVLYQCITVYFLELGWCMFEFFLFLIMNVILAEFRFLSASLSKILKEYDRSQSAIQASSRKTRKTRELASHFEYKTRMSYWIQHHANTLRFMRDFGKIYSPILASQYLYIVINMCGLFFCSASGQIPGESSFYCYIFIAGFMVMTLRLCRCGDNIAAQSCRMGRIIACNFPNLPVELSKDLKIILLISDRAAVISVPGIMTLQSQSFRQLVFLQYRFYRFFVDTHQ